MGFSLNKITLLTFRSVSRGFYNKFLSNTKNVYLTKTEYDQNFNNKKVLVVHKIIVNKRLISLCKNFKAYN